MLICGARIFRLLIPFVVVAAAFPSLSQAQGVVTTLAGTEWLFPGDGRPASDAPLSGVFTFGLALDKHGNYYIADSDNQMVFKVTTDGILHVVAGNGFTGRTGDGGPASSASLAEPVGVVVDGDDNVFILDQIGYIRKVTPDGIISTVAGTGNSGFSGDGQNALSAQFNSPFAMAIDSAGALYIADRDNNRIRKITPDGIINTIAGNGAKGHKGDGGPALQAAIDAPTGVAVDGAGNVYFTEPDSYDVRMVTAAGIISTVVGGGPNISTDNAIQAINAAIIPNQVASDAAGDLLISDFFTNRVRLVLDGKIYTVAGNSDKGFSGDDGPGLQATLNNPTGLAIGLDGSVYFGDSENRRVRHVDLNGVIQTVAGNGQFRFAGEGGPATSATLYLPTAVAVDKKGNLYITEPEQARVRKVAAPSGIITTFAGTGDQGFSGDGGPAAAAELSFPAGLAVDRTGSLYIADQINGRVRKVAPDGTISTVAGNGHLTFNGDNIPATTASLAGPSALAFDSAGNLYIADTYSHRVRKVTADGNITTFAGTGTQGYSGDGGQAAQATLYQPAGLAFDAQDNLYIADSQNSAIRKVTPKGVISTVAGNGISGFGGDGGPALKAMLREPDAVAVDAAGNVYIGDVRNFRIRKVTPDGVISTFAGTGAPFYSGDGGPAASANIAGPISLAIDSAGDLIFADWFDHRVRAVLTAPPAFQSSPNALSFSGESGGIPAPAQSVQLAGSIPGIPFADTVSGLDAPGWLQVTPSAGSLPASALLTADPSGLAPGTYRATVNFQAPYARPAASAVAVTFTVSPARPAMLAAKPDGLSFSVVQGAPPVTQNVTVSNQGGGALDFSAEGAVNADGSWLAVSPEGGTATPANSPVVTVTADPTGLAPGAYSGVVTIDSATTGESAVIPVVLTISPARQTIRLLQTGLTFTAVAGGAVTPPQGFGIRNAGQGAMSWSAAAGVLSGGSDWLAVTPDSGTSDAALADAPLALVGVNPDGLAPGAYYGQVSVSSPGADNTPQQVSVALNVLPANSNPGPIVQPSGLVFTGVAGGESPGSQTVTISNLAGAPVSFTSAGTTMDGAKWFAYLPATSTIAPRDSTRLVVQPKLDRLAAGVYRGSITLLFAGGGSSAIGIVLVVAPAEDASQKSPRRAAGCAPTQLIPLITSASDSFQIAAAWPTPVQAHVVDDCGNPMLSGSVVATFSNADPPRVLTHTKEGDWSGTWQPHGVSSAPVTVTVNAQIPQLNLKGSAQVTGGVRSNLNVPVITSGSVTSAASLTPQAPIAPGSLISIFGSSLADGPMASAAPPLQTTLGTTSVLIAGSAAPLVSVSDGRIDALVPYGTPPNTRQQVIVQRGPVITAPEPVTVAPAQPAIFTADRSGSGQGSIFALQQDGGQTLADPSHPVTAGDRIVIQCAGLGAVNPSIPDGAPAPDSPAAATVYPVSVSIGGVDAAVSFSGLTPGTAGTYQVNATIPAGVSAGDAVPVTLTVAGQVSPAVTIAVQ